MQSWKECKAQGARQRLFLQECLADGIDAEDAIFLADLEFDESGDVKPGSIYDCYRKKQ